MAASVPEKSKYPVTGRAFDEFRVGEEFTTRPLVVSKEMIVQFGELTLDTHPLHNDEEYCRNTPFGSVIAHGLLGLALIAGLKSEIGLYRGTSVASLGWDNVRFHRPVPAGATVYVRVRIAELKESKRGDRGVLRQATTLLDAEEKPLIEAEHLMLVLKRAALPHPSPTP